MPDLEQKLQRKKVIRKLPDSEVTEAVRQNRKFIIVENNFDNIPFGYALIDMRYKGDSFKTLVPQSLLFYMANPGEGDADDALDEIADFYDEVKEFEYDQIDDNSTNVQGANWAVLARDAYSTYLINRLTRGNDDDPDVAEFDEDVLNDLDLDDDYVMERARALAAVALDKSPEEVRKFGIDSVLKHVTVKERETTNLTREEFDAVTCWAGSHYEIEDEYRHDPNVDYNIEYRHDKSHKVGTKNVHQRQERFLDANVARLEQDIESYRRDKKDSIGRHDANLMRMYVNLTHIARENPNAQLIIEPQEFKK